MERLVDPVIADLQTEHAAAIRSGNKWNGSWVLVVGYIAFVKVTVWCGLLGLREARRNWSPEDSQGLLQTMWLSGCAIVVVSMPLWLLELPTTLDIMATVQAQGFHTHASVQRLMIYLLPAVVPLTVPVGLAIGAALDAHGRMPSRRLIGAIMLVAFALSGVSLITIGWVTPATNQSYREAMIGVPTMGMPLAKGNREMTLIELRRSPGAADMDRTRALLFEFHSRLGIAGAPITFAVFALVVAIRRRARRTASVAAIAAAAFGYYMALGVASAFSQGGVLSPQMSAWVPQLALVLTTVLAALPRGRLKVAATTH
jgi:lipopolysaccharide export LptBFGC system permease protein LptF